MDNKKIDLQEVQDGTLAYAEAYKVLKKQINAMFGQNIDAATAVDFVVKLEQDYGKKTVADKAPQVDFLMILGTCKGGEWRAYLKEQVKVNKKKFLMGTCYVSGDENNPTLYLLPDKGGASIKKIKAAGKMMFNKLGLTVALETGMEELEEVAEDEAEKVIAEETKIAEEKKKDPQEQAKAEAEKKAAAKAMIQELAEMQMQIKSHLDRFKELAKDGDAKVLIPVVGEIKFAQQQFQEKVAALKANGMANDQLAVFEKNASSLDAVIKERFAKFDEKLVQVRDFTKKLVDDINALLQQVGFDPKYLLKV